MRPLLLVKVGMIMAGVIAGGFWIVCSTPQRHPWTAVPFPFIVIGLVVAYMITDSLDQRSRRRHVLAHLEGLGFVQDEPLVHAGDIHYSPRKRHHSFAMKLYAEAQWRGRRARVAEFQFQTGHGKGRHTWLCFQAALECPPEWPVMELLGVPRWFEFHNTPERAYREGEKLGDPLIDRRWRVATGDLETARIVLKPDLRSWLADGSWRERWCVRDGWLSCTRFGACDERKAEALLGRAAMFLSKAGAPAVVP